MARPLAAGALFVALFVANGLMIGWTVAYEVMVTITSPADTTLRALAWFLSVAGRLAGPGVAGAVVGHVVSTAISARRAIPFSEVGGD